MRINAFLSLIAIGLAAPSVAEERIQSNCIALADAGGTERVWQAAFADPVAADHLRIHFVDHATFLLKTPGGLVAATDYAGLLGGSDLVPDVVTMNNYHHTHWTNQPDPRIPHVLRGWPQNGVAAQYELDLGGMLVRNVTTDTRGPFGEGALRDGNSIFIFEAAGLCIGHLGHLHQVPSPAQYAAIGRMDVLMVPVDGGYTMDLATMSQVVKALHARVVLPMHWFSGASLEVFLTAMSSEFEVVRATEPDLDLSLDNLPDRPQIIVLPPTFLP